MAFDDKPRNAVGYDDGVTQICESVLLTLLGAFSTLADTVTLVGGLAPRYITPPLAPRVPAHAGTRDVDMVLDLAVIADGESYAKLAKQLKKANFKRFVDEDQNPVSWRWSITVGTLEVFVEFLADAQDKDAGKAFPVGSEKISALAIKHAAITHDWYIVREVTAKLLDGDIITCPVRVADVPAFVILKALALHQRRTGKDAADLIHVLRYASDGQLEELAALFVARYQSGKHRQALDDGLQALRYCFCHDDANELLNMIGPARYAQFHSRGDDDEDTQNRRYASGLIRSLLDEIETQLTHAGSVGSEPNRE